MKLKNMLPNIIVATVVLRNSAIIIQDIEPEDDDLPESYITSRQKRGPPVNNDLVQDLAVLIPVGVSLLVCLCSV